ncbi:BamA/OMP85 family outer membrane protein [Adhaeribacter rhizoryzae]|uniref:BamA/TamA family outer membrane protein n=1 Tax=Adhaeribacter rhizoryzae TaxID=2607907 RepID=A0A5M6D469_9BACT|nr:BamA/TamA family outer membrane protein [Adhaeribacter rhizoryzae]KAA5542317.1 BamA/TamA family outer membrane protein [Adhaeribacter rhizoryzae]
MLWGRVVWGCLLLLSLTIQVSGQAPSKPIPARPVHLVLKTTATDQNVLQKYNYKKSVSDSLGVLQELKALTLQLQNDAYLTASADSFYFRHDTLYVQYFVGERYRWARLRNGNLGDDLLLRAGYKEKLYQNVPFLPKEWARLQEDVLTLAETSGYPFARIYLDSVQIQNNEIDATVVLDKGRLMVFDTLQLEGNTRTTKRFLSKYLQLYPGQAYNQQKVARVQQLLRQLPYIEIIRPAQVHFSENKATLVLFLNDKKANQLDGIVGFLPDPNSQSRKFLINGEITLNIRNMRGSGKQLGLQWRKVERASQLLDANYVHPNILGSPFELSGRFNLHKQDSTFITLRPRLELSYYTLHGSRVSFFTQMRSSRLLLSPAGVRNLKDTLQLADVKYNAYGISYQRNTLDDIYFPRQGYQTDVQLAVGNKNILRNNAFEQSYYDTISLRTTQLTGAWRGEYYHQLTKNSVILTRLQGETLFNKRLYLNDLFRLGGLTSIRGFTDFSFYASTYAVGTLEYRFYTAPDSYLLLFYDQGYYRRDIPQNKTQQYPFGLGGGISFSTGAGIFQFVYSVGRSRELKQPISLNFSKIHFGIVSRF